MLLQSGFSEAVQAQAEPPVAAAVRPVAAGLAPDSNRGFDDTHSVCDRGQRGDGESSMHRRGEDDLSESEADSEASRVRTATLARVQRESHEEEDGERGRGEGWNHRVYEKGGAEKGKQRVIHAECAAVVLEPVVGNSGFIPPSKEFLEGIRALTEKHGALLVFDEVMTGFRIDYGCAQKHFGVTPDVTTMGKVIGGGLPVGAYGGRRDIMEQVAPAGPMYQAGTLSGNPLAMTAGIKTLEILSRPGQYEKLTKLTERLVEGILREGKAAGHAISGGSISGMFGFFFCEGPVTCFREATASDTDKFARWHRAMLERGVYLAPSQYEAGFMSLAHTDEDIDHTIASPSHWSGPLSFTGGIAWTSTVTSASFSPTHAFAIPW